MSDQEIVWRDWGNAVPISEEKRDQWARECLAHVRAEALTGMSTSSGDSRIIVERDAEYGELVISDVIVRRTARVPMTEDVPR